MSLIKIQKNGRPIRRNSEDIVEKIARRLIGRYLGVSAMYFSRPIIRCQKDDDLDGNHAEPEIGLEAPGYALKAKPHSVHEKKKGSRKKIQSIMPSCLLICGKKVGSFFQRAYFNAAETISRVMVNNRS